MAGGIATYAQRKLLDHILGTASWTITSPLKLKLYTADPDFDAGTGGTEKPGTGGYTTGGNSITNSSTSWNAAATQGNGYRYTNKEIAAFSWTASADWTNDIVAAAMFDNGGTNMLWGKGLDTDRLVYNGDTIRFASAAMKLDLDVTVDAGISLFWKKSAYDHLLGLATYTAPTTAYIALFTAVGSSADWRTGTYANFTEVSTSGTSYARKSVTMASTWDAADASGIADNTSALTWTQATGNWGTVMGAALVDTASGAWTGGSPVAGYFAGNAFTGVPVNTGDTFSINAGDFDIKID